jgi:hypothetical protein
MAANFSLRDHLSSQPSPPLQPTCSTSTNINFIDRHHLLHRLAALQHRNGVLGSEHATLISEFQCQERLFQRSALFLCLNLLSRAVMTFWMKSHAGQVFANIEKHEHVSIKWRTFILRR